MKSRIAAGAGLALAISSTLASAADLPPIKVTENNAVPACATPGRLMSFIRSRNSDLDPRFEKIAVEYMRRGEEMKLRWDYAFFQMAIETGYLTFKRDGNRNGDVRSAQNNFAGIGATGRGQRGDSFEDMPTGVLAHLQHVSVYAGDIPENPVADRTRKIIQWGIGEAVRKRAKGEVTFTDLAKRWATGSEYANAIETHAQKFYADFCRKADPHPEMVAEARGEMPTKKVADDSSMKGRGREFANRAIVEGKAESNNKQAGLGMAKTANDREQPRADTAPSYSVLNAPKTDVAGRPEKTALRIEKPEKAEKADKPERNPPAAAAPSKSPSIAGSKCRVFTASYGGQKAVIIKAHAEGALNYTVLDVNEGAERREADAYISAYAKGGAIAGEFSSQMQALDKAFELCPEG